MSTDSCSLLVSKNMNIEKSKSEIERVSLIVEIKKKKKCSEKLKLSIINTKLVDYNRFKENIHNKEVLREEKGWGKG